MFVTSHDISSVMAIQFCVIQKRISVCIPPGYRLILTRFYFRCGQFRSIGQCFRLDDAISVFPRNRIIIDRIDSLHRHSAGRHHHIHTEVFLFTIYNDPPGERMSFSFIVSPSASAEGRRPFFGNKFAGTDIFRFPLTGTRIPMDHLILRSPEAMNNQVMIWHEEKIIIGCRPIMLAIAAPPSVFKRISGLFALVKLARYLGDRHICHYHLLFDHLILEHPGQLVFRRYDETYSKDLILRRYCALLQRL